MFESTVSVRHDKAAVTAPRAALRRRERGDARIAATRALDVFIAVLVILFTLPLLAAIALAIRAQDGGPALFAQERVGRNGRRFRCLKFRSMVLNAEARLTEVLKSDAAARAEWGRDHKLRNDPRITGIGDFLRRSSLDELPQLFNVLRGDMSIVGPRPIVMAEIPRYGRHFEYYCAVRPGITGLWQVSGRNDISYRRRVAMDTVYARHKSLGWDLKLLILTIPAVLFANGSY